MAMSRALCLRGGLIRALPLASSGRRPWAGHALPPLRWLGGRVSGR
jgi:hypothetical protein